MTETLQKALKQVRETIALKSRLREQLDAEIAQLQATEIGLQNTLGQEVQAEIAWTDLVRAVINNFPGQTITAVQVRDTLQAWGYNFGGMKNPLAFFNTVLTRLADRGEIKRSPTGRPFKFGRK